MPYLPIDDLPLFQHRGPTPANQPAHRNPTLEDRFQVFHAANPHVYAALRRLALRLRGQGVERYGIAGLFEVLRYEQALQTNGEDFRLNNSYRAFYARMLMDREPELKDFFEIRERRTW